MKAVGRWEGIEMKRRGSLLAPESARDVANAARSSIQSCAFLRVGLKGDHPHLVAEMCPMRLDSAKGAGVADAERLRLEGPLADEVLGQSRHVVRRETGISFPKGVIVTQSPFPGFGTTGAATCV